MTDYFTLERADILNQLNQMGKENKIDQILLKKNINELYRIFHTIAAPKTGKREETMSLYARQYACYIQCVQKIFDQRYEDAFWELYDIIEAGEEENLTYNELATVLTALTFFKNKMEEI